MRNNFHRTLLVCVPLLLTGCSDVNEPLIPDPKIATTAITSTSVELFWNKATDSRSPSTALVYKIYLSGANPAYQSFDAIGEVEAGTLVETLTDASSTTISSGILAGNAYYINIVVLDEKGNKALYDPLGEYFHADQISYYPFNGDGNDAVAATANHLVVAVDPTLPNLALPAVTSDRFGHTGSAYSFNPTVPQCLQSTNPVGITGSVDRSVSFWVQSSNTPAGTRRAPFAWGNDSGIGTSFGFFEAGLGNYWTVWLGTANVLTSEVATSSWEHWVISSTGGSVSTYKNGVVVNNGDVATVSTLDSPLYVGCGMVAGALDYPYQGNIDDVRVFNQLLTGPDVVKLYAVTRP
jgi:Concanavalin A-like lectin/glucanases superfamily